jgi:hypothetical protein
VAPNNRPDKRRRVSRKVDPLDFSCQNCGHSVELHVTARSREPQATAPATADRPRRECKRAKHSSKAKGESECEAKGEAKGEAEAKGVDLPVVVTLSHVGYWITNKEGRHEATLDERCDRNSVMLAPDSMLYVYKIAMRHYLLSRGVLMAHDVDNAMLVPHVKVRDNKDATSFADYVQNRQFRIAVEKRESTIPGLTESHLSSKDKFLMIELDLKRDLHYTLVFAKNIKARLAELDTTLIECFKETLRILNAHPHIIKQYSARPYFGAADSARWERDAAAYPHNVAESAELPAAATAVAVPPPAFRTSPAGSIILA